MAEITLSVYFNGTDHDCDTPHYLAMLLYNHTVGIAIDPDSEHIPDGLIGDSQLKMCFDGCGVTNHLPGRVFGTGIDAACSKVVKQVAALITAGHDVTINAYGHSRGGIAALKLAKHIRELDESRVCINLALLDPVPGNLVSTPMFDFTGSTQANESYDQSRSKHLKRVLALYTNTKMHFGECFHAPLLPIYPVSTDLEEDGIYGCHSAAQRQHVVDNDNARTIPFYRSEAFIAFERMKRFMEECGSDMSGLEGFTLKFPGLVNDGEDTPIRETYNRQNADIIMYRLYKFQQDEFFQDSASRYTHSKPNRTITTVPNAVYLNKHHQKLAEQYELSQDAESTKPIYNITITGSPNKRPSYGNSYSLSLFHEHEVSSSTMYGKAIGEIVGAIIGTGIIVLAMTTVPLLPILAFAIGVAAMLIGYYGGGQAGRLIGTAVANLRKEHEATDKQPTLAN